MLNRIDSSPPVTRTLPSEPSMQAKGGVRQIFPAHSPLDLAQAALRPGSTPPPAILQPTSLADVLDDTGFALLQQRPESRQGSRMQRSRAQPMLQQLVQQMKDRRDPQLENLLLRMPPFDSEEELADHLRKGGFNAGELALLLAALASDEKHKDSVRRRRLEAALNRAMDNEQWAVQLFCTLEFGVEGASQLGALKALYQRAADRDTQLTQWFDHFRKLANRRGTLRALIRALAFELSAQEPISGTHLASVITDLKRILHFFSIEDHCARVAEHMNRDTLDDESIMLTLLDTIQQPWIYADWLDARTKRDLPGDQSRQGYARHLNELTKLLPQDCFVNVEQRESILDAWNELLDRLDTEE